MWYICTKEYYSAVKKNEMPFAATWMDLTSVTPSEVRERQLSYDITYMWNLEKNYTSELVYKTETDLQLPKGKPGRQGYVRSLGLINTHTLYKTDNQQGHTVQHRELNYL